MLWPLERPLGSLELDKIDLLLGAAGLLGQENGLDVGQNTTLGDGDTDEKLVQFLVVSDGELKMSWDDPGLLVVTGCVTGQFKDLGCQILHNGCKVDWGTGSNTLAIVAFPQQSVDTSNWELKSSSGAPALRLSLCLSSLSSSRHIDGL